MKAEFLWHKYRYFPYEFRLAQRELVALTKKRPFKTNNGLGVSIRRDWKRLALRTTYFERAVADNGQFVIPHQALLEIKSSQPRKNNEISDGIMPLARQSTRYSAHGIHEYRGKFNPQIVRVIGNILNLKEGEWVLDPFCGCGTTLLEAAHNGWNSVGVDLNPLGVMIANAKIASMKINVGVLKKSFLGLQDYVRTFKLCTGSRTSLEIPHNDVLSKESLNYLERWFSRPVLCQLFAIMERINKLESDKARLIFNVILSDIVREVSLQDPSDLRVRRRKTSIPNGDVFTIYLDRLTKRIENISSARELMHGISTFQEAIYGDSRECANIVSSHPRLPEEMKFRAAITSPPYATALPYIDTQRLSLILFGLLEPHQLRLADRSLIGSRELLNREKQGLESALQDNPFDLPAQCISLCSRLNRAIDDHRDGFRRKNVPTLLYKYFCDMSTVFSQVRELLSASGSFALVVGQNKTFLGGKEIIIDAPTMLVSIAKKDGYKLRLLEELDTYQRYDVHRLNSITSESLLILDVGKR